MEFPPTIPIQAIEVVVLISLLCVDAWGKPGAQMHCYKQTIPLMLHFIESNQSSKQARIYMGEIRSNLPPKISLLELDLSALACAFIQYYTKQG